MGDSTISQLPSVAAVNLTDFLPLDQTNVTKKATVAQVYAAMQAAVQAAINAASYGTTTRKNSGLLDASSAGLTLTQNYTRFVQGSLVKLDGYVRYPVTADGNQAKIALPDTIPAGAQLVYGGIYPAVNAQNFAVTCSLTGGQYFNIMNPATGAPYLNSDLSNSFVSFSLMYQLS